MFVTPEGTVFPTGETAKLKDGSVTYEGGILVDRENNEFYHKLKDGTKRKYRTLYDIDSKMNLEIF